MPSSDSVELHRLTHTGTSGTTTAVVAPAWGANIVGFAFQPQDLLWPISFLESVDAASLAAKPTSYGAPVLAPTPGRTGATEPGAFRFDGRLYRMAQARHGFLRSLPWTVTERTPSSITCAIEVTPSESLSSFPFAFHAEHRIRIADGFLEAELSFLSTGHEDQPISAGWHPYLHRDPDCRLHIPAASFWELDGSGEPVPTGRRLPVAGPSDFRAGRVIEAAEHWDLTLTDLAMENGAATSGLDSELVARAASGESVRIAVRRAVRSDLTNIQLYTAPGRPAIAVEPFSSPPDAVNLMAAGHADIGVRRLRSGETTRFSMALGVCVARR
jgi:aldose 1-epimerase